MPMHRNTKAAAAALGATGGVALAGFVISVTLYSLRDRDPVECRASAQCPTDRPHCLLARCVECLTSGECSTGYCDPTSNRCAECTDTAQCPGGYACQSSKCVAADCNGQVCTDEQTCVGTGREAACECVPGLTQDPPTLPDVAGACREAVSANPRPCDVAPSQKTGLFRCTGVPGVEAQYSGANGGKTWSIDQIALDYYDDPGRLLQSFPGNSGGAYDPTKTAVMSAVGCPAPQADGGTATDNCSRGLRLKSLGIGTPAARHDETRSMGTPDDVDATFFARQTVFGTEADWVSGGVVPGNVYPSKPALTLTEAAAKSSAPTPTDTLRLRVVGDLVPEGATVSSDNQELAPGLGYTACPGCGGNACAGDYCAGAAPETDACQSSVSGLLTGSADSGYKPCPAATVPPLAAAGAATTMASSCNPISKPNAAACMLAAQCPAFPTRASTPAPPAFVPPLATGAGSTAGTYARTGGQVASRDVWGPGEYEFVAVVPAALGAASSLTDACLPGYAFSLGLESENEILVLFDPTFGTDDEVAKGEFPPDTCPKATDPQVWVPSEQAPWSSKLANDCAVGAAASPTLPTKSAQIQTIAATKRQYLTTGATGTADFVWTAAHAAPHPACVPVGQDPASQLAASNTYQLLGCLGPNGCLGQQDCNGLNAEPPLGTDTPTPTFTCQAVDLKPQADGTKQAGRACLIADPADAESTALNAKLKAFWKTQSPGQGGKPGDVGQEGRNCIAFQQAWQTGIEGARWCGHNDSYVSVAQFPDKPCLIAADSVNPPGPRLSPALQARYQRPDYDPVLFTPPVKPCGEQSCVLQNAPETPYMAVSNTSGSTGSDGSLVGGDGARAKLRHSLAFQIPSRTKTSYNTGRGNGAWGFEAANLVTGLADNGVNGTSAWHTEAMVVDAANVGLATGDCAAALAANPPYASTAPTESVRYRVRWWADEDPTKSFVEFSFARLDQPYQVLYSTTRFVPSRGGRWVVGPWAAPFATGYDSTGKPAPAAFEWAYVDLVSASFRPYRPATGSLPEFVPVGRSATTLKLRAIGSSRDQRFGTSIGTLPSTAAVAAGTADTAGQKLTCSAATGPATCEVRCGLVRIGTGPDKYRAAACTAPAAPPPASGAAASIVRCFGSADCTSLAQPRCNLADPANGYCTGCIKNADCTGDTAARCDQATKACVPCRGGPDTPCKQGHGPKTFCESGQCVNPTASDATTVERPPHYIVPVEFWYILMSLTFAVMICCAAVGIWVAVRERRESRADGTHGRQRGKS